MPQIVMVLGLGAAILGVWWQVECDAGRWRCCIPIWLDCKAR